MVTRAKYALLFLQALFTYRKRLHSTLSPETLHENSRKGTALISIVQIYAQKKVIQPTH